MLTPAITSVVMYAPFKSLEQLAVRETHSVSTLQALRKYYSSLIQRDEGKKRGGENIHLIF